MGRINHATNMEGDENSNHFDGSDNEELDGLDLEERKRKRVGPALTQNMGENKQMTQNEAGLSNIDCRVSQTLV